MSATCQRGDQIANQMKKKSDFCLFNSVFYMCAEIFMLAMNSCKLRPEHDVFMLLNVKYHW